MWATDIQWDVDIEEAIDTLNEMKFDRAAKALGLPSDTYANMTTEERNDYAYDYFHHRPGALCEFFDLPDKVYFPDNFTEEDISDFLSNEYGFCHRGFELN